jgi:excisionase family DNA binding protein
MEPELIVQLDRIEHRLIEIHRLFESNARAIPPMYTVKDVARRLNVSTSKVSKLISQGLLVGAKIGGSWRMKPENLERWIDRKLMGY